MVGKRGRPSGSSHRHHVLSLSLSPEPSRRGATGNNKFGARGTLKCLNCRNRKAKCEFETKEADCRWCAQRGLACGDKLLGEKHQIREHRKLLGIGNTPLSVIAEQLERAYPRRTPWEISEMAREALILAGDGPSSEIVSSGSKSMTPMLEQSDLVKIEGSPKTPPMTYQTETFLASAQKTPPRSTRPLPRLSLDHLPTYEYPVQYSMPVRQHFAEHENSSCEASYLTERIMEHGPWLLTQPLTWQEPV